ncbi:CRISPR-associated endonuclease/helicase Cas3 [Calidithermus roseus]|uniref:CRISPR-associated endonuclease/helicase Cas3 n=1 Tax=Calidithermus roseus TaxID=1644118 RepID=A0A399F196_9DEIN|nr:CRISPR-associated endonuclease/helicase Cas3 [Calidithermus roseus]
MWAKSDREKDEGSWHPLIAHLLDVAASAEVILEREPPKTLELYARDLKLEPQQAKAWICALAGLHDIGKASPAFQQKWPEGKERVWATGLTWSSDPTPPPDDVSHSVISEAVLPELLEGKGWTPRAAQNVAAAVGEHHGFRASQKNLDDVVSKERGKGVWDEVRRELFEAVLEVLEVGEAPQVCIYGGAAFERLAGLTSFADWIGSSLDFHPLGNDLAEYYRNAKARAAQKLDSVGWFERESLMPEPQSLEAVFAYLGKPNQPFKARPLQTVLEGLLEGVDKPALFLVEAPMGEGKTEAALYAHLRLQAANGHRGMYIALPTQATGNLMFERAKAFLGRYGASRKLDLQLLHGASELVDAYQNIVVRPNAPSEGEEGVGAQVWFSHRKRGLLSEYAVGTVDQALLSILPTKHHFVRLWGLGNRVVVLDEVHAYDTYTSGLIESLVRWLKALDSSVVLMSATLPKAKRESLLRAFGAEEWEEEPYPRITRVIKGNPRATTETFAARPQPTLTLKRARLDLEDIKEKALEQARSGGCVACIVNTVQRAQDLYRALVSNPDGVEVHLFHARYPLEERLQREQTVLAKFGKEGVRPHKAILVATQVVEQSLDLDFDVMFTDLAPVDLVLQRAGRLHRHARSPEERRGHTKPVLWVAGLEEGGVPDFDSTERIYERYILLRSWLALHSRTQIDLPCDIDRLVQEVYSEPPPQGLSVEWKTALEQAQARMDKRDSQAQDEAFYAAFGDPCETDWLEAPDPRKLPDDEPNPDDDPSPPKTRKGRPSATVVLLHKVEGRLCLDPDGQQPVSLAAKLELAEAKRLFARSVKLSRHELTRNDFEALKAHRESQGLAAKVWSETPLLAHAHPVVLEGGCAVLGELELELHSELGVVYRR